MAIDIKAALSKSGSGAKFSTLFIEGYMSPAFGARLKAEIDLLVFTCLIEAKAIDPDAPVYDIARALNIPPARVRNLILNWQLRSTPPASDLRDRIVAALKKTRFSGDGKSLASLVRDPRGRVASRARPAGANGPQSRHKHALSRLEDCRRDIL